MSSSIFPFVSFSTPQSLSLLTCLCSLLSCPYNCVLFSPHIPAPFSSSIIFTSLSLLFPRFSFLLSLSCYIFLLVILSSKIVISGPSRSPFSAQITLRWEHVGSSRRFKVPGPPEYPGILRDTSWCPVHCNIHFVAPGVRDCEGIFRDTSWCPVH
jgi:hypothetical protein